MSGLPAPILISTADDARVEELRALVEHFNAETDSAERTRLIERIRELRALLAERALEE